MCSCHTCPCAHLCLTSTDRVRSDYKTRYLDAPILCTRLLGSKQSAWPYGLHETARVPKSRAVPRHARHARLPCPVVVSRPPQCVRVGCAACKGTCVFESCVATVGVAYVRMCTVYVSLCRH